MKIVGWEKKGNVVRFYLSESAENFGGDDWSNSSYEHNALTFPLLYAMTAEVSFDFDINVLEPKEDTSFKGNSPYSMDDFVDRKFPILIFDLNGRYTNYTKALEDKSTFKVYMGDDYFADLAPEVVATITSTTL